MKFIIDPAIFEKFPGLTIGAVVATNLDNEGASKEITELMQTQEERIKKDFSMETLSQQPNIEAWRNAYQAFGAKPKEHRSSVENLYQLVLQGLSLRHINKLVDVYNLISLAHMLPVGGEDLTTIQGDIRLTFASNNETPMKLLGDKEPRTPHEGEVIYKDELSAICRRWNWREADRTKLTEQTKHAILVIEGLSPIRKNDIESATLDLKQSIDRFCGGNSMYAILDEENSELLFS